MLFCFVSATISYMLLNCVYIENYHAWRRYVYAWCAFIKQRIHPKPKAFIIWVRICGASPKEIRFKFTNNTMLLHTICMTQRLQKTNEYFGWIHFAVKQYEWYSKNEKTAWNNLMLKQRNPNERKLLCKIIIISQFSLLATMTIDCAQYFVQWNNVNK